MKNIYKILLIILLVFFTACTTVETETGKKIDDKIKEQYLEELKDSKEIKEKAIFHGYTEEEQLLIIDFVRWANQYNIELVGLKVSFRHTFYNGLKKEDYVGIKEIPGIIEISNAFHKVPEEILRVMEGKTIYISQKFGGSHVLYGGGEIFNRGFILEQPIREERVIHEFGHVVDEHGIKGVYDDPQNHWGYLREETDRIFKTTVSYDSDRQEPAEGYISVYSMKSRQENFADHFMAYVYSPEEFRRRAQNEPLLKQKYDFFKNNLFGGVEY